MFNLGDGIGRFDGHALLDGLATAGFIADVLVAGSEGKDEGEEDDEVGSSHAGIGGASLAAMAMPTTIIELKW